MITGPQVRSVLVEGGRLLDSSGGLVGPIAGVLLDFRTSQPAWVTVDCPLCGEGGVVVPLARARLLDTCIQVPYTTAEVCGAPGREGTAGRFDRRPAEELRRYYAALDDAAAGRPNDQPPDDDLAVTSAAAVFTPMSPDVPTVAGNGHQRTNGVVSASGAGSVILPVVAGLDVRSGDGNPAAYPPTPFEPWPPVTTSSLGPPWWQRRQWRWPSRPTSVRAMRLELRPLLDLSGLPEDELDDLVLATGEAATNAVEHTVSPALPFFDVSAEVGAHRVLIVIQDHGRWRAATAGGDRGRGLHMIGVLADATVTVGSRGTTVVLCNRAGNGR